MIFLYNCLSCSIYNSKLPWRVIKIADCFFSFGSKLINLIVLASSILFVTVRNKKTKNYFCSKTVGSQPTEWGAKKLSCFVPQDKQRNCSQMRKSIQVNLFATKRKDCQCEKNVRNKGENLNIRQFSYLACSIIEQNKSLLWRLHDSYPKSW